MSSNVVSGGTFRDYRVALLSRAVRDRVVGCWGPGAGVKGVVSCPYWHAVHEVVLGEGSRLGLDPGTPPWIRASAAPCELAFAVHDGVV